MTESSEDGPAILVTASPRWHPRVVGLIASRLKERFHRPAIAIALQANGTRMGSGRSIIGVDLGHAIRAAVDRGILVKGGGHAMAAGLTVAVSRLGDLRAFLQERLALAVEGSEEADGVEIDAALIASGATADLIGMIDKAGPFGSGHPEPIFAFPSHRIAYADTAGNGHVRVALASADGTTIKAMAFRSVGTALGDALLASRGEMLHVAGSLSVDHWQGREQPSLRIVDAARPVDSS